MSVPRTLLGWGIVLLLVGLILLLFSFGFGSLAFRLDLYDARLDPHGTLIPAPEGVGGVFAPLMGLIPLLAAAHAYGKAAFELDMALVDLVLASYLTGASVMASGAGVLLLLHALLSTIYTRWRHRRAVATKAATER